MPNYTKELYIYDELGNPKGWNTDYIIGKNIHKISPDIVKRMADNFEW